MTQITVPYIPRTVLKILSMHANKYLNIRFGGSMDKIVEQVLQLYSIGTFTC